MKRIIASSLAALLLILAPAEPAVAQDAVIERLTELCRPQMEAYVRDHMVPDLQRALEENRSGIADSPPSERADIAEENRFIEETLADLRDNGINGALGREWIDAFRQASDSELRNALVELRTASEPQTAAEICLAEARLTVPVPEK